MPGGLITEPFEPRQMMTLLIVGGAFATGVIIVMTGVIAGVVQSMARHRLEADLKREMLARGMSADEISHVIAAHGGGECGHGRIAGATDLPFASEVVVESLGDWRPGLVLQAADGRYLVHYVGDDMDSNEWVGENRVRFPVGSRFADALAHVQPSRNGTHGKPPVEAEI